MPLAVDTRMCEGVLENCCPIDGILYELCKVLQMIFYPNLYSTFTQSA